MAITLSENWSAYAENTQVQNITGWTTSGAFNQNRSGAQVNAASQIKSLTSDGTLAFFESGNASHYVGIAIDAAPSAGVISVGPAVRCNDWQNFIGLRLFGSSNVQIFHRTGSTTYTQLALPSNTHVAGDIYWLDVDGDTLRAYKGADRDSLVQLGTDIDITGIQSGSLAGFWVAGAIDPALGAIEVGTLASNSITIDSASDREIITVFGTTTTHTISGSYEGDIVPTEIEYRIEEFVSGTVITDWATLDASPSLGVYSEPVIVPRGDYYRIRTRFSNDNSVAAETQRIGFGINILAEGQSNIVGLFGTGGTATPSDNTAILSGPSTWNVPTTQIISELLNLISEEFNCCVGITNTAVSNSSIGQHLPGGSNYTNRQAALTNIGGKVNAQLWGQGEGDTGSGAPTYKANLASLRSDLLTRSVQSSDTLLMFIIQLGRNEGQTGNDTGWQGVRAAQTEYVAETSDVYISHQTLDLPMRDGLHRTDAGYIIEMQRAGDTYNAVVSGSGNTGLGPIPISASVNGTDVEITHDLNGSTSITLPANAQDGYEVSEDDFVSLLTISSISTAANMITLTTSASIYGEVKVRSQQGQDPDEAKMPTGNLLYSGQAVMVAPIVSELQSATVSSILNLTATGLPDGSYSAQFWNDDVDPMARLKVEDVTFASGQAQTSISLDVGANIYTRIDTPTPLTTGVTCIGVTE